MKPIEIIVIVVVVALVLIFLQFKAHKQVRNNLYVPVVKQTPLSVEAELLRLINEYRIANGLDFLQLEQLASDLCREHVEYEEKQQHASHDYFVDRSNRSHALHAGEITAQGYITPKSLLAAYLSSPAHKAILDNPIFNWIGISTIDKYNCCLLTNYEDTLKPRTSAKAPHLSAVQAS